MNKSLRNNILFLLITILAASAITVSKGEITHEEEEEATHVGGIKSRFLGHVPYGSGSMSCEASPRVCQVEGSPGPDCCSNKCVNLLINPLNCGRCGKKCGFHKMCCEGKCVNPMTNQKHCGKCGHRCDDGSSCLYGMCSYA